MNKKNIGIISGIIGIVIGLAIVICSLADVDLPKPVWLIFAIACMLNAVLITLNYRRKE